MALISKLLSIVILTTLCMSSIEDVNIGAFTDSHGTKYYNARDYKKNVDTMFDNLTMVVNYTDPEVLKKQLIEYIKEKKNKVNEQLKQTNQKEEQEKNDAAMRSSKNFGNKKPLPNWGGMKPSDKTPTRRIMNGIDATIDKFGFMVSIHRRSKFWCNGVLLRRDFVLTTAHCLQYEYNNRFYKERPTMITVRAGCNFTHMPEQNTHDSSEETDVTATTETDNADFTTSMTVIPPLLVRYEIPKVSSESPEMEEEVQSDNEDLPIIEDLHMYRQSKRKHFTHRNRSNKKTCTSFKPLEYFFHPNYDPTTLNFNFALIRLEYKFRYAYRHTMIIAMGDDVPTAINKNVYVLGWGSRQASGLMTTSREEMLQMTILPVIPKVECAERYGKQFVHDSTFCGGALGTAGGCNHDAGGAAVDKFELVGLLSSGPMKCGEMGSPNIFSRVGAAKAWIDRSIASVPHNAKNRHPGTIAPTTDSAEKSPTDSAEKSTTDSAEKSTTDSEEKSNDSDPVTGSE